MQEFLQNNRTAVIVVCLLAAALGMWLAVRPTDNRRGKMPKGVYFYDLGSGDLFTQPLNTMPPVDAPSGPGQGVLAYVFTCGSCSQAERQVLYLETLTDQAKQAMQARAAALSEDAAEMAPVDSTILNQGTRLAPSPARGEEPHWIAAGSAEGRALRESWRTYCDGSPAKVCSPN